MPSPATASSIRSSSSGGDERELPTDLRRGMNSIIRTEVARVSLADMLSQNRAIIMGKIADELRRQAPDFGVEVMDVRLGRTDLPDATSQAVYNRMRSARVAQAAQLPRPGRAAEGDHPGRGRPRADHHHRRGDPAVADAARRRRRASHAGAQRRLRPGSRSSSTSSARWRPTPPSAARAGRWCSRPIPTSSGSSTRRTGRPREGRSSRNKASVGQRRRSPSSILSFSAASSRRGLPGGQLGSLEYDDAD